MGAPSLDLNLAQRRTVATYEPTYKTWKASFDKVVGFEMNIDCNWNTFFLTEDGRTAETTMSCWTENYFDALLECFTNICQDNMGKKAVKEGVKKIVITGMDTTNPEKCKFENSTFFVNHSPYATSEVTRDRAKHWQELIEKNL